jgi:hypothetical protein
MAKDLALMVLGFVAAWIAAALALSASVQIVPHPFFPKSFSIMFCALFVTPFLIAGVPFGIWAYCTAQTRLWTYLRAALITLVCVFLIIWIPNVMLKAKIIMAGDMDVTMRVARFVLYFFGYGIGPALAGATAYWFCAGRHFTPEAYISRPLIGVKPNGDPIYKQ